MAAMTEDAYLQASNLARIRMVRYILGDCTFMDDIQSDTARAIHTQLSMLEDRVRNDLDVTTRER